MKASSSRPVDRVRLRALVVEEHRLLGHAFRNLVAADPAFEVIGTAASADAAVRCVETLDPQVVFLDWSLPGHEAEVACRRIRARANAPRIVALVDGDERTYGRVALAAGADEAIGKPDFGEPLALLARCLSPTALAAS